MHTTVNGITLSFVDVGQGLPLVFVHGFPLSRGTWQSQVDALRSSNRVIAPDLRGFGESDSGSGPIAMTQYAADVHALLQHCGTGPVVLIGHSMGGYVALAFARQFPGMLQGLVLVGTKACPDTAEVAVGRRETAAKVESEGVQEVIDMMTPRMLAAVNRDADRLRQVRGFMASSKPAGVIGALLGMAARPDSTAPLARIVVPTLVVTGAEDALIPPTESEKLARAIPGAQLCVIPDAGHLVAFEQPDAFNHALADWLTRIGPA